MSYCYLLYSRNNTYIGATVNPDHRLRQHNGEIVGGAKRTKGHTWKRALYVSGFPNWVAALQFEWAWKRKGRGKPGLVGKLVALVDLVRSVRSTKNALPFVTWPAPPPSPRHTLTCAHVLAPSSHTLLQGIARAWRRCRPTATKPAL
jgi:predicted GIY-YIG superfamily endonuclease